MPVASDPSPAVIIGMKSHRTMATDAIVLPVLFEIKPPLGGQLARLPASTNTPAGVYAPDCHLSNRFEACVDGNVDRGGAQRAGYSRFKLLNRTFSSHHRDYRIKAVTRHASPPGYFQ